MSRSPALTLQPSVIWFTIGHHRLVIDPASDNEAAIRCYSAVCFRPVGTMRRYEHDGLLMDLLAEDLGGVPPLQ